MDLINKLTIVSKKITSSGFRNWCYYWKQTYYAKSNIFDLESSPLGMFPLKLLQRCCCSQAQTLRWWLFWCRGFCRLSPTPFQVLLVEFGVVGFQELLDLVRKVTLFGHPEVKQSLANHQRSLRSRHTDLVLWLGWALELLQLLQRGREIRECTNAELICTRHWEKLCAQHVAHESGIRLGVTNGRTCHLSSFRVCLATC